MSNRGIGRARMFFGGVMLFAAVIAWFAAFGLSPSTPDNAAGIEGVRGTIVTVIRSSAIWTLVLSALAAWLLFPTRRPRWPVRDWAIIALLAVLVLSSIYQLIWLETL